MKAGATCIAAAMAAAVSLVSATTMAQAQDQAKPNILVIWGDDIGYWNISAYNQGMMGYKTPNIDRLAKEGALFTDYYGQQSCTAGRAAFITGQTPFRTGLLKVGLPGAKEGLQREDVTLAELLKAQGYATGQFGKNHLGDLDEHLPTAHGFDEFYGSLYHLNAEEEPENPDYPKDPAFREKFGPRGTLHTFANPDGTQRIENTGPLTKKRMETVDEEFTKEATGFMENAVKDKKPFFVWWNSTRMHIWTHLKPEWEGKTELGVYPDGMVEHDTMVGELLAKLDELGIADNTIVMYSTDNGAEKFTWPDGGTSPFRGEKNTNWEGGFRVPAIVRWPGLIKPGTVLNDIVAHEDWVPTLLAAAGEPDIKQKLLTGYKIGDRTFKDHLDGYDQTAYFGGKAEVRARNSSTSATTPTWWPFATTSGRSSSRSNGPTGLTCGRMRSATFACQSSSTSVPIHSRPPITKRWTTAIGEPTASSSWSRHRPLLRGSWRPSRSSRRGRRWAASRSSGCSRN